MSEYDVLINKYDALNAGYDQLYPKPMKHANTHASGGADPITPGNIGAYSKNETDTLLANKEDSFSVLPLNKGGTGVNNITALRREVGIGFAVGCDAGKSVNITLPDNGSYLICANDNVRRGVILVQTGSTLGTIRGVTVLSTLSNWSYEIVNGALKLSETDGEWGVSFYITSLSLYAYSGG